jgi:CheY-like chemotaxis protein
MEKDSRDRTVLIVEDSDDARYFMRLALEQLGYLIVEAENGAKALEVADRERPDIILMDLSLPIMDGLAATEKIRASEVLGKIPIVAVTAHQETDFRAGAKAAGFDAYVTKPIDIDFLSDLIKGLLAL